MSKSKMFLTLAALSLLCLSGLARAQVPQPKNLWSADRLAFAVGANYSWHSGSLQAIPPYQKEVEVGAFGSYALTSYQDVSGQWKPRLILTASSLYGLDNKSFHTSVGLRLPIFVGKD